MIADRELVEAWEAERDDLIHNGFLRVAGTHPNGEPKCVLTWKGRRAAMHSYVAQAWDGWCDLAGNDEAAFWIACTLLGGCAVLAFILYVQHVAGIAP